ncbi:phosphoribosylaminoimidazolecarboxamide formyltransferase/IMP cyclohydrolase [Wigglesworthia glossinidia endosymbiont of Glossina morsitans morsitans (Yale colony)]|uniref:Bifunctional purine biosynthesis protein PurH n=1 Tax=Wigglesworthia glossinidia endosymbiont of Glossina morsitans morsitans (Yale colony) TaxID=1142511 RepID=H6Q4M6_WIGGL|nr:bifunctional phosphoribosylaminoimidazolecarboxamide formyltransferase/IMP cyclohydrolase [Wigglesworthia glossinidia]AFA41086.1 phosphoribosylaminoimidazolecarboxamide formyltransferase/IMP cyclohydrolase [Wigglesworthia glossinidia endosymbiont of Glossina morsitans morsitans (Yale colony)]
MKLSLRNVQCALLSVSNKTGILLLAQNLVKYNIKLVATSGTAKYLSKHGISVISVSEYIDYPEILNGKIKTLHPKIHAGILSNDSDQINCSDRNYFKIDMVVTNFYPFSEAIEKNYKITDILEYIDIGGLALARSAAKNYRCVTVLVDHKQYPMIIEEMHRFSGSTSVQTRFYLAIIAFSYTYNYDKKIFNYFNEQYTKINKNQIHLKNNNFPYLISSIFLKKEDMRYGENQHQKSAFYTDTQVYPGTVSYANQKQGKKLSYNNIIDADIAIACVMSFEEIACVIVKHAVPCSVAISNNLVNAYSIAYSSDPSSSFGGIIAFNKPLDIQTARIITKHQFSELIIAPVIEKNALTVLKAYKNIRVLECGYFVEKFSLEFKRVHCGLLVQEYDNCNLKKNNLNVVTNKIPSTLEVQNALFLWKIIKFVKSNAIIYGKNQQTLGIGSGQSSRIFAAKVAFYKAQEQKFDLHQAIMASDGFFPFRDTVDFAAKLGISCIIQPGGSIHDLKIIAAANEHNMSMIFTNVRCFRH